MVQRRFLTLHKKANRTIQSQREPKDVNFHVTSSHTPYGASTDITPRPAPTQPPKQCQDEEERWWQYVAPSSVARIRPVRLMLIQLVEEASFADQGSG